ncbi:MAG: cytochrome c biogenesis protein CcdA [Chloroflexi bacterium]|nr:cytochrome c biogenesis protein CcdA [Chloroflexota bacterium]
MLVQKIEPRSKLSSRLVITLAVIALALTILALAIGAGNDVAGTNANLFVLALATFVAGVLSFLSPCTLPILPGYFVFTFQAHRQNVAQMTLAFFLGLATTITLLGASATSISQLLARYLTQVTLIGGLAIIAFGVMSLFGKGFAGAQFQDRPATTWLGSYLYGATFALGWSACIGPILGAVLTLLATQGIGIAQGALLAFVYALGLGAPLILVSTFFGRLGHGSLFWRVMRGKGFVIGGLHFHTTGILSGALLIAMGMLLASGQLAALTQFAQASELSRWVIDTEETLRVWFGLK